ncbi:DUF5641 domain-containing protein [Trichonephila clavata]|uniref:DUF5641 domain-containing protein n=1 Tax=Trichonephila clavata TaxID=2740835 RepID=A0A8X6KB44_TRICU|nr:DUF5641 domain-containing protein [Trichonephila clavata]
MFCIALKCLSAIQKRYWQQRGFVFVEFHPCFVFDIAPVHKVNKIVIRKRSSSVIIAALNSRPLIYEEESDDNSAALTPAHFLTGRKLTAIPSRLKNTRLNKIYKQQQDLLDCFWKKWSKEYLLQLRSFHQVRNKDSTINIRVGDIVLLQEDVRPRHMWKKASDEPRSGTRWKDKILRAES